MYTLLLLLLGSSSIALSDAGIVCDGLVFNDKYYDKKLLFKGFGRSYDLVMHRPTGQLFFSHALNNESNSYRNIKYCSILDNICGRVKGIEGGNAVFYHKQKNDLYFGTYSGVFLYNFRTKQADFLIEKTKPTWDLFINNDKFYYITYPGKKLYVYNNNTFTIVQEVADVQVDNFFATKHSILYFSNSTGLYKVQKPQIPFDPPILISDKIAVRQITEDAYGNAYFAAKDGIYIDDVVTGTVKKLAHIEDLYSYALISSGVYDVVIVYSDKDAIYRLDPSANGDYCYNLTQNPKKVRKILSLSLDVAKTM